MVIESVIIMIIMTYSCNILLTNFHDLAALTESEEESRVISSPNIDETQNPVFGVLLLLADSARHLAANPCINPWRLSHRPRHPLPLEPRLYLIVLSSSIQRRAAVPSLPSHAFSAGDNDSHDIHAKTIGGERRSNEEYAQFLGDCRRP